MTEDQRIEACKEQIQRYLYSYYPQWRMIKILSIKKILDTKYDFYQDFIEKYKQPDDLTGNATIAQEITNGLLFNAISECLQYIEDLFLLLKFSQDIAYFVRNVITYKAGTITNFIDNFTINEESACRYFHIPQVSDGKWPNEIVKNAYKNGLGCIIQKVNSVTEYFKNNEFFYNQYKHGLTVALRPFSLFDEKLLQEKENDFGNASLFAWDNLGIRKIISQDNRFNGTLMFPLTPKIQPYLDVLQKEDNLLRLVTNVNGETRIDDIVECAKNIRSVLIVFINNFAASLKDGKMEVWLPDGDKWIALVFNEAP